MIVRWPCRVRTHPTSKITTYGWSIRLLLVVNDERDS
jgi:hypothetical protein